MGGQGFRTIVAAGVIAAMALPSAALAKRNLYVSSGPTAPKGIASFDFDANGGLVPLAGPTSAGTDPAPIAMTPDGQRLYAGDLNATTSGVSAFAVDPATGLLAAAPGSPFTDGGNLQGITITPDGRFVYLAGFMKTGKVSGYAIAGDGSLITLPGSPFESGASGADQAGVAASPDGRFVYVANFDKPSGSSQDGDSISALAVTATGALTPIAGSPFLTGDKAPADLVMTPDGKRLYSANLVGTGTVSGFTVGATGALVPLPGSPFPTGDSSPIGLALTPDGSRLYVSHVNGSAITGFDIAADGTLTRITGTPFDTGAGSRPTGIAVTPDGKLLYVSDTAGGKIQAFTLGADGSLAPIVGSPFAAGVGAPPFESLVITPNQPPVAAFAAGPAPPGSPTAFDATISTDPDGTAARFDWDFGDGEKLADGGPAPSHTYAKAGTYSVSLTVTDNEGCSTTFVFTGQLTHCNGGASARVRQEVKVPDIVDPVLTLKGAKLQRLGPAVEVKASCSEPCKAVAEGKLIVKGGGGGGKLERKLEKFRLFRAKGKLFPGNFNTLRLKLPPRVRKATKSALEGGAKAKAKIVVNAHDPSKNKAKPQRRTVRLVR